MTAPPPTRPIDAFAPEDRDLVQGLRDPSREVRLQSLDQVREIHDEVAEELLRLVLTEPDAETRAAAAIALGPTLELCDWELDEDGKLPDEPDAAPLSQAAYQRVTSTLEEVHRDTAAPDLVRRRALEAAVRSPRPWQEAAIREASGRQETDWRLTALFCMGYWPSGDFAADIEVAFRGDDQALRLEAIRAAGQAGLTELLPEVSALAADPAAPERMRMAAIDALGAMGDQDSLDLLQQLADSSSRTIADFATEAMEYLELSLQAGDPDDWSEVGW